MRNEAGKLHSALRRVLAAAAALALLLAGTGAASAPAESAAPAEAEAEPVPPPAAESPPPETAESPPPDGSEEAAPPGDTEAAAAPAESPGPAPVLYAGGKIHIYNYQQLIHIASGDPVTDADAAEEAFGTGLPVTGGDGLPVTYAAGAVYVLMNDIPLPEGELWSLPADFTGRFENGAAGDPAPDGPPLVYDPETDTVYLYNPRQLRAAGDETGQIPVTAADWAAEDPGTGEPFFPAGEEAGPVTYGPDRSYVLAAAFTAEEPEPAPAEEPLPAEEPEPAPEEEPLPAEEAPPAAPEPEPPPAAAEAPPAEDTATVTIRSVWKDRGGAAARPDSAEITLYRTLVDENGGPVDETGAPAAEAVTEPVPADGILPENPVVLTAADRTEAALWQTVIEGLPAGVTDESGRVLARYAYSVEEAAIDGYSTALDAFSGVRDGPDGAASYEYVFTLTASASPLLAAEEAAASTLPYTGGAGGFGAVCFGAGLTLFGFGLRRGREDGDEPRPEAFPEEDEPDD